MGVVGELKNNRGKELGGLIKNELSGYAAL